MITFIVHWSLSNVYLVIINTIVICFATVVVSFLPGTSAVFRPFAHTHESSQNQVTQRRYQKVLIVKNVQKNG